MRANLDSNTTKPWPAPAPEAPFICHDGKRFWRAERCAMRQAEHITARMAEDILEIVALCGEDHAIMAGDLVARGWSQWHVATFGPAAAIEARGRGSAARKALNAARAVLCLASLVTFSGALALLAIGGGA